MLFYTAAAAAAGAAGIHYPVRCTFNHGIADITQVNSPPANRPGHHAPPKRQFVVRAQPRRSRRGLSLPVDVLMREVPPMPCLPSCDGRLGRRPPRRQQLPQPCCYRPISLPSLVCVSSRSHPSHRALDVVRAAPLFSWYCCCGCRRGCRRCCCGSCSGVVQRQPVVETEKTRRLCSMNERRHRNRLRFRGGEQGSHGLHRDERASTCSAEGVVLSSAVPTHTHLPG